MRQVSATEARKNFFTLLDYASKGETILINRNGISIKITRDTSKKKRKAAKDYSKYIHSSVDDADQWSWDWDPSSGLKLKK